MAVNHLTDRSLSACGLPSGREAETSPAGEELREIVRHAREGLLRMAPELVGAKARVPFDPSGLGEFLELVEAVGNLSIFAECYEEHVNDRKYRLDRPFDNQG
jgi:hypothetical protein